MMSKKPELTKEERAKAIADFANKKKAQTTAPGPVTPAKRPTLKIPASANLTRKDNTDTVTLPSTDAKKVKAGADAELDANVKPKKVVKDSSMLSVSEIARAIGVEPKVARAKLRKDGNRAPDGRWPLVKKDSKEHLAIVALLESPKTEEESEEVEEEVEE